MHPSCTNIEASRRHRRMECDLELGVAFTHVHSHVLGRSAASDTPAVTFSFSLSSSLEPHWLWKSCVEVFVSFALSLVPLLCQDENEDEEEEDGDNMIKMMEKGVMAVEGL